MGQILDSNGTLVCEMSRFKVSGPRTSVGLPYTALVEAKFGLPLAAGEHGLEFTFATDSGARYAGNVARVTNISAAYVTISGHVVALAGE